MPTTHEYNIKTTGLAELSEPLEDETDYRINGVVGIDGINQKPNHDGTKTFTHIARWIELSVLDKLGKTIITTPKALNSPSKRLRQAIWSYHQNSGSLEPFDEFYEKEIKKLISSYK